MRFKQYINEATMFNTKDRVEGKYIDGTKFVGSIKSRRFHSYNSDIMIYKIKLDNPYKGRDTILINWDVKKDKAMDDAELKPSKKKLSKATISAQNRRQINSLKRDLERIPKIFGKGPKADAARKEIEDEIKQLQGK
jgi:hypothetical protein